MPRPLGSRNSVLLRPDSTLITRKNLSLLRGFMRRHGDLFEWVEPKAGAVAFVRFLGPLTTAQLGQELAAAGIGIKPAYCFTPGPITPENDYFRVGFGESVMAKSLEALEAFVQDRRAAWATQVCPGTD